MATNVSEFYKYLYLVQLNDSDSSAMTFLCSTVYLAELY